MWGETRALGRGLRVALRVLAAASGTPRRHGVGFVRHKEWQTLARLRLRGLGTGYVRVRNINIEKRHCNVGTAADKECKGCVYDMGVLSSVWKGVSQRLREERTN